MHIHVPNLNAITLQNLKATPYLIPPKPSFLPVRKGELPPEIDSEDHSFHSSTFVIHSSSQETTLNEIGVFKYQKSMKDSQWAFEMVVSIWRYSGPATRKGR